MASDFIFLVGNFRHFEERNFENGFRVKKIPCFFGVEFRRKSPKKSYNFFQYDIFVKFFFL
jgi:hypothetical protein